MKKDLFKREQIVYNNAKAYLEDIQNGAEYDVKSFEKLVREYGKLLKQSRRAAKLFDKTTEHLNASNLELMDKVHYDGLTGIYNRRYMEENLKRTIKTLSRNDNTLSLLMIDIDFFKNYNDTYGHTAGDDCLKAVATAISDSLQRTNDYVVRYGGEEFTVILPNSDKSGAILVAAKVLENVILLGIPHEKSAAAEVVTVSVGGVTGRVNFTQTSFDYIKRADEALYASKQNGRNRYTCQDF